MDKTIKKLINLTEIFEKGYTVEYSNGKLKQYHDPKRPYVVSYLPLVKITKESIIVFSKVPTKRNVIGYWKDSKGVGWIKVNETFKTKKWALKFAKYHGQECIYNLNTGVIIDVN